MPPVVQSQGEQRFRAGSRHSCFQVSCFQVSGFQVSGGDECREAVHRAPDRSGGGCHHFAWSVGQEGRSGEEFIRYVNERHGYTQHMPIDPDLQAARTAIHEARHVVIVTPVWWRSVPALLKGFLDRVLLPREEYQFTKRGLPESLLMGRTGRVFITSGVPLILQRALPRTRLKSLTHGTLRFCGISPVRATHFGAVRKSTPEQREQWIEKVARIVERDSATSG